LTGSLCDWITKSEHEKFYFFITTIIKLQK
jgi:hypothetical protein